MARLVLPAIGRNSDPFELAHFVGVAAPAVSSYLLHKHFTFARSRAWLLA
jgi:putative flippase GtrA